MRAEDDSVGNDMRCRRCDAIFPVREPRDSPRHDTSDRDRRDYDDDSPAPRRRRPRPQSPPPRGGRSPLFWIMLLFGGLIFSCFACCGGLYFAMSGEKWRTYESPAGGYAVEIPVEPQKNLPIPGMKPDPNLKTEGGVLWKRGESYIILHGDIPSRRLRAKDDDELLREAVNSMSTAPEVRRVVRNEAITVSGFPGREVEYVATDGGSYFARVVIADRKLYVLVGGGRFVRPGNANIRRFLDSFAVTDPTLEGGVAFEQEKKKEEATKEAERRAAAEHAVKEAAHRMRENEAFRTTPYDGPKPGDPRAFSKVPGDVIYFSLDTSVANGVGQWGQTRPLCKSSTLGPGVRGNSAFLTTMSRAEQHRNYLNESPPRDLPVGKNGFTFSGWYKARHRSFDLFAVTSSSSHLTSATAPRARVRIEGNAITVSSQERGDPLEFSAPRPADNKWHHVAVVFDQTGRDARVTLFIDGEKVASGVGVDLELGGSSISVGVPHTNGPEWSPLTNFDGTPIATTSTDFIGAIDECAIIDRPLVKQDIRKLVGIEPLIAKPRRYGADLRTPFPVPAATEFSGLKTYFPFDEMEGVLTRDVVGNQLIARCSKPELIVGPRGMALRGTSADNATFYNGLPFMLENTKLVFEIGKPLTLTFWVRTEADKPQPAMFLSASHSTADMHNKSHFMIFNESNNKEVGFAFAVPGFLKAGGPKGSQAGFKHGEWMHIAVTRNEKGKFRFALNGAVTEVLGDSDNSITLQQLSLGYGSPTDKTSRTGYKTFTIDYDELCIFDRELTDDELAALAGQKAMPKR